MTKCDHCGMVIGAVVGGVVAGPIGLVVGALLGDDYDNQCPKCGNK